MHIVNHSKSVAGLSYRNHRKAASAWSGCLLVLGLLWTKPQAAPDGGFRVQSALLVSDTRPALSRDSSSKESTTLGSRLGFAFDTYGVMTSLDYLHTDEVFNCLFGCMEPAERTDQFQVLIGKRLPGRFGFLSAQAGPALLMGVGRGARISDSCAGFLSPKHQSLGLMVLIAVGDVLD